MLEVCASLEIFALLIHSKGLKNAMKHFDLMILRFVKSRSRKYVASIARWMSVKWKKNMFGIWHYSWSSMKFNLQHAKRRSTDQWPAEKRWEKPETVNSSSCAATVIRSIIKRIKIESTSNCWEEVFIISLSLHLLVCDVRSSGQSFSWDEQTSHL